MRASATLFLLLSVLSVFPCFGQVIPSMVTSSMRMLPDGDIEIRATYKMEPGPIPAFLGDPYSLKRVFQKSQVLADGTKIERQTPEVLHYQDSAGRFRAEYPFRKPANFPNRFALPPQVEIIDSVAGYHYVLDTVHRIAHRGVIKIVPRQPLPPPARDANANPSGKAPYPIGNRNPKPSAEPRDERTRASGEAPRRIGREGPELSTELLGEDMIEGVPLEGRRTVATYPAGSRMGNDGPVSITTEEWTTPGSTMPPFRKTTDPRSGEEKAASYDIVRSEPDPSLFQIPANYQIVDEPGPFAITFVFPAK